MVSITEQARRVRHSQSEELKLRRVPREVAEDFKRHCHDKFVGDYGMALKDILEKATVIYPKLIEMEERLKKLEEGANDLDM